jgi:hypothetical protein
LRDLVIVKVTWMPHFVDYNYNYTLKAFFVVFLKLVDYWQKY